MQQEFLAAYLATTYRIFLSGGDAPVDVRIGEPQTAADLLLRAYGASTGAIISAHNPFSRKLSPEENLRRQAAFEDSLAAQNMQTLPALGLPDDANWPAEPSVLLFDLTLAVAREIAAAQAQNALVWLHIEQAPQLIWTHPRT